MTVKYFHDEFSKKLHDEFESVMDNSLERRFGSEDIDYVMCVFLKIISLRFHMLVSWSVIKHGGY